MLDKHVIYGLFDPNTSELRYIGYTSNPKERYDNHHRIKRLAKNNHKNNWIKSLLLKDQKAEMYILEEYPTAEELPQAEIELIEYYKSIGCDLVNGTDGGDGFRKGRKLSHDRCKELSLILKGNKRAFGSMRSEDFKLKVSQFQKGKMKSSETKRKISSSKRKLTDDQVLSIKADHRSSRTIAKDYKISNTTVLDIKRGKGIYEQFYGK